MNSQAQFMIHNPALAESVNCVINYCDENFIGEYYDTLVSERNKLLKLYTKKTPLEKSEILSLMRAEEFMSFRRALDLGFVGAQFEITEDTFLKNHKIEISNFYTFKINQMETNDLESGNKKSFPKLKNFHDLALKIIWVIFVIVSLLSCFYLIMKNVFYYYDYNVK
jgi:hypothetical protein